MKATAAGNHVGKNNQCTLSESLGDAIAKLIRSSEIVPTHITLRIDVINEAGTVLGRLTFSPTKTEKVWQC
jgi:hypothetical protein